jgi:hypothetical protein
MQNQKKDARKMPQVLTTKALIRCPHQGMGQSTPTDLKWSVDGGIVLLENDMGKLICPFAQLRCESYQLRSMGLNATRIGMRKVILVSDFNLTNTGLPLTMMEFHTTIDNSTPTPIPLGQDAPPLPPELTDMTQPGVTALPVALEFNATTMQPATLAVTFTLTAAHPMRWLLRLLNEPLKASADITNGQPPGLIVTPAGGAWNSSPLLVTVTMTAAFMAALTRGDHHFFMTGVSQRGISKFIEVLLTVKT